MRFRRKQIYAAAWALLLSIFVLRNAPVLCTHLRHDKTLPSTPNASIDHFLGALLLVREPTTRLNEAFVQLPPAAQIFFVSVKNDARWDFVYSAVCYLTWPRKIDKVELGPNEPFTANIPPQAAVIFCGMAPTINGQSGNSIGPNLTLLPPLLAQ